MRVLKFCSMESGVFSGTKVDDVSLIDFAASTPSTDIVRKANIRFQGSVISLSTKLVKDEDWDRWLNEVGIFRWYQCSISKHSNADRFKQRQEEHPDPHQSSITLL